MGLLYVETFQAQRLWPIRMPSRISRLSEASPAYAAAASIVSHAPCNTPRLVLSSPACPALYVCHEYTSRTASSSTTALYSAHADSSKNGEDIGVYSIPSTQPTDLDPHCLGSSFPAISATSAPHNYMTGIVLASLTLPEPTPAVSC